MSEHGEMNMVYTDISVSDIPEDKDRSLEHKGNELLQYLYQMQATEILLLDLLRNEELSKIDYHNMLNDGQAAYKAFLKKLTEHDQDSLRQ